jgi:hypothetical protein
LNEKAIQRWITECPLWWVVTIIRAATKSYARI